MAAARLSYEKAMVGTDWANSCPGCMNRHRKHYSHLVGGVVSGREGFLALSWCLPTESADYGMLVNEWAWLHYSHKSAVLKCTWFSFGVRTQTAMKIWCIKVC